MNSLHSDMNFGGGFCSLSSVEEEEGLEFEFLKCIYWRESKNYKRRLLFFLIPPYMVLLVSLYSLFVVWILNKEIKYIDDNISIYGIACESERDLLVHGFSFFYCHSMIHLFFFFFRAYYICFCYMIQSAICILLSFCYHSFVL